MHPGFRYHIASLLAVFFSLMLGILIGGALVPDQALVEEQALFISQLEERLRESGLRLANLQAELELSSKAWQQLRESIASNCLTGRAFVLVGEAEAPLASVLQQAGAQVDTVPLDQLSLLPSFEGRTVIFPLVGEALTPQERETIASLAAAGTALGFVWGSTVEPDLSGLPPSLQVDSIDTTMGEVALLLALAADLQGHFGLQKGAVRLFP